MKQKNQTRISIVGCGAISQLFYAEALSSLEAQGEARVVRLFDPVAANRAALGRMFPQASQTDRFKAEGLGYEDLVIVASPPRFHAEQSIAALKAGASVLCEKPMAMSAAECQAMVEGAGAAKGHLAIGLYRRFFPAFAALREIIETQPYGPLQSFAVREGSAYRWAAASASFSDPKASRGGVFFDVGPHVMDILLWLFGEPANWSYADDALGGLEVNASLDLQYNNGISGSVRLSKDWDLGNTHTFVFEKADVVWPVGQADRLRVRPHGSAFMQELVLKQPNGKPVLNEPQCFTQQIDNLIRAMRGTEDVLVTGEEGARSLRFIDAAYARRQPMEMGWLSEDEAAALSGRAVAR
ncbi:MAG: Gfo/Idh/MocA family oxidoreductase [Opitutales bacterium]|nr:Gfo/Idh/MocA family oxidoreductase [Opitutales bacterium]